MESDIDEEEERFQAAVRQGLSGQTVESPPVRSILLLLRRQAELEVRTAVMRNLGDEMRQYNAGRAAALADVVGMVEEAVPKGVSGKD